MTKARKNISFILNRQPVTVEVEADTLLITLLRETLGLTGTKQGCGEGECGACTVLVDNETVNACIFPAWKVSGATVMTVEGLGTEENPHLLQEAFLEAGAVQCGFCTPGMLISSYALLQKNKEPAVDEIKNALAGNLCRCTGYIKILDAVQKASLKMKTAQQPAERSEKQ